MILTKDALSKMSRKGRTASISLLNHLCQVGNLPEPYFEYRPGGYRKKRSHYHLVRFKIPQYLLQQIGDNHDDLLPSTQLIGSGRDRNKQFSKTLAALEVIHQLEFYLHVKRNTLSQTLEKYKEHLAEQQASLETAPLDQSVPHVAWHHMPMDPQFPSVGDLDQQYHRRGRIEFFPSLVQNAHAFSAAKAITLTARKKLPHVNVIGDILEDGHTKKWANIRASGRIKGFNCSHGDEKMGETEREAELYSCVQLGLSVERAYELEDVWHAVQHGTPTPTTFGMAKLFVEWPQHQFEAVQELVDTIVAKQQPSAWSRKSHQHPRAIPAVGTHASDANNILRDRIECFRKCQQRTALPIDQVEQNIPFDAAVVVLRGGTGSGKTTRYPLMLSLLAPPSTSSHPIRVVVAQPRRLACTAAAHRVASEQGCVILGEPHKRSKSPIGYAIRFDARPADATMDRTVNFMTPGVLLRQATTDPLLSSMTHLCIDEVHERNADIDLLLALAKQAVVQRQNHATLPPLQLTLMSATLDSEQWESYFEDTGGVVTMDAPDARRFPIAITHLGQANFPLTPQTAEWLNRKRIHSDYDEALCKAAADVILHVYRNEIMGGQRNKGSILCFLPGMEEIKRVDGFLRGGRDVTILHLHSSVEAREQAKVFRPGPKIILSTNLAETSVTIPDVKVVIDSGRERQFSMLDSASDTTTVVGSQLVTVNISKGSAQQRAGRAGRVSAGTCYRLYTKEQHSLLEPFTKPEMLRMDLSQMVIRTLSLFQAGRPLSLLEMAPDPPSTKQLAKTVNTLKGQALVTGKKQDVALTPLGAAVGNLPATPRLGRMLVMALSLRAIEPALTIAALLSVPRVFRSNSSGKDNRHYMEVKERSCSDLMLKVKEYATFCSMSQEAKGRDRRSTIVFQQVQRVRDQLERSMREFVGGNLDDEWNVNAHRVGAQAALVASATPHIAHLVTGANHFATRDLHDAVIHPSSTNWDQSMRVHWYVYHELRRSKNAYMNVTTAVSPLEIALFSDPQAEDEVLDSLLNDTDKENRRDIHALEWLFIVDEWVPVDIVEPKQRADFFKLKHLFLDQMLQHISRNPREALNDEDYAKLTLYVLSALEQQRLPK